MRHFRMSIKNPKLKILQIRILHELRSRGDLRARVGHPRIAKCSHLKRHLRQTSLSPWPSSRARYTQRSNKNQRKLPNNPNSRGLVKTNLIHFNLDKVAAAPTSSAWPIFLIKTCAAPTATANCSIRTVTTLCSMISCAKTKADLFLEAPSLVWHLKGIKAPVIYIIVPTRATFRLSMNSPMPRVGSKTMSADKAF